MGVVLHRLGSAHALASYDIHYVSLAVDRLGMLIPFGHQHRWLDAGIVCFARPVHRFGFGADHNAG